MFKSDTFKIRLNSEHCVIDFLHFLFFFADPQDENKIGIDGIQQFCDDLMLEPTSMSILVVAWKFRAATQCEFSRKEFLDGMAELGSATLTLRSVRSEQRSHKLTEKFVSCTKMIIIRKFQTFLSG